MFPRQTIFCYTCVCAAHTVLYFHLLPLLMVYSQESHAGRQDASSGQIWFVPFVAWLTFQLICWVFICFSTTTVSDQQVVVWFFHVIQISVNRPYVVWLVKTSSFLPESLFICICILILTVYTYARVFLYLFLHFLHSLAVSNWTC